MRFYVNGTRFLQFFVTRAILVVCCQLITDISADYVNSSGYTNLPQILKWTKQNAKLENAPYNLSHMKTFLLIKSNRRKRQTANPDFTWKVTKTPKFVTAKTEKHPEPVLRVYPPDPIYRSGRSRELPTPQHNAGRRVIYYATLPEVVRYPPNTQPVPELVRYPPNTQPVGERYTNYPTANQQRSFGPSKGGKEFVTRVQSSIIDVRPRGDKKEINSTPSFTIIEANPTPYSGYPPPYNRIQADFITHLDKPSYNYLPSYYSSPKQQFEIVPQNTYKAHYPNPYYGNVEKSQYQLAHYQYQQQSNPYYQQQSNPYYQQQSNPYHQQQSNPYFHNDIGLGLGKIPSQFYSPPYPSRHTRFPSDRYPITSPLSHFDIGIPPTSSPALSQSHSDFNQHNGNLQSYQPSLGFDSPPTTFSSPNSANLDFNSNFGTSLDHGLELDDHHSISPLKDKFPDYNSLSQKYLDLHGFNDVPFKYDNKELFKFDKEPFKSPFSQVSDWLTNKPFDLTSLDLDDPASSNRDYQVKGSSHSVVVDSQMVNQNITTAVKDSNNTIITPFTSSNSSSIQDEATNSRR